MGLKRENRLHIKSEKVMDLEDAKKLMEYTINRAKNSLGEGEIRLYGEERRHWLEASLICKDDESYTVKLFVLEGTPPKGYILADYSSGIVKVFSGSGEGVMTIKTFKVYKFGERLRL